MNDTATPLATDAPIKVKRAPKIKSAKPALAKAEAPAPVEAKTVAPKAAKPTVAQYTFVSGHTGPSDGVNEHVSRVAIDFSRFGTLPDAKLTERDKQNIAAFRNEFGGKHFERGNLDTGIIKRLGERGYLQHVRGGDTDPKAVFRLIAKAA